MLPFTRQVAPPTALPLTLAEAEAHCRLGPDEDSEYLTSLIRAVAALFERESKQALMATDYVSVFSGWSGTLTNLKTPIVADSLRINYTTAGFPDAALPVELYALSSLRPDALYLLGTMPALLSGFPEAVRVKYRAGYETADQVPPEIKQWLKLVLLHYYENRQPSLLGLTMQEVPMSAKYIMDLIREPTL